MQAIYEPLPVHEDEQLRRVQPEYAQRQEHQDVKEHGIRDEEPSCATAEQGGNEQQIYDDTVRAGDQTKQPMVGHLWPYRIEKGSLPHHLILLRKEQEPRTKVLRSEPAQSYTVEL